jgi:hypothetical protein
MPGPLAGPGQGLQYPQNLYPSELGFSTQDASSNKIALAGGQSFVVPRGDWIISDAMYCVLQYIDPVTNAWSTASSSAWEPGHRIVASDGFSVRIANMTGCPVAATIIQYGGGWVQSSTTIGVTGGGGSTWAPVVGGQLGNATVTAAGAGYGVAPLVFIPPPPNNETNPNGIGGIQASGYAVIASGTVSGFTFNNPGAGYPAVPTVVVVPSPFDPNLTTGITTATITVQTVGSGSITAVICTNNGNTLAQGAITLTPAGVGTNATVAAVQMLTCTAVSLSGTGTGWGTLGAGVTSTGGAPSAGTITNGPDFLHLSFRPRQLQATTTITGLGSVTAQLATIIDGGLFEGVPQPSQQAGGAAGTPVGSTIALTMGTTQDIVVMQPFKN